MSIHGRKFTVFVVWVFMSVMLPQISSADPIHTLFANTLDTNPLGGNCAFQCVGPQSTITVRPYDVVVADNFKLGSTSLLTSFSFDGIRTGTNGAPNLDFSTLVDWTIYTYNPAYLNGFVSSSIGDLLESGSSAATQLGTIYTETVTRGTQQRTETAVALSVPLPSLKLPKGSYWLALHANVSGWDFGADDTALYLAYGLGDGIFAWNLFPPDGSGWTNPNPGVVSGMAFSIQGRGRPTPVPEPSSLILLGSGLVAAGASTTMRYRRSSV